jgi:hypothetical protein
MDILIHPAYFPSVSTFAAITQSKTVTLEMDDNYQKQTNRNRMYIYSPNGIQLLNIPIKHSRTAHQKTRDIKLETAFDWQKQHFKSLEAAYRSSPFFEYFEDDLMPVFEKQFTYLMDLNLETMSIVSKCLGINFQYNETTEYFKDAAGFSDFRHFANGKKDPSQFEFYPQVFGDKHGFINNLSIVDLLFNEGRHAITYLKNQELG